MNLGIEGKRALVTGGLHGIGKAIADALRSEGCEVMITCTSGEGGIQSDFLKTGWDKTLALMLGRTPIDILINNAGSNLSITDPYCKREQWDLIMDLNFYAPVQLCNMLIPGMKERDFGRIVNILSVASFEVSGAVTYACTKAALAAYTHNMGRILASECRNVIMSGIFPGVVLTDGGHWDRALKERPEHVRTYLKERCPAGRFGLASEIASAVLFQCSQLASFSHGAIIGVDGGQSKGYNLENI